MSATATQVHVFTNPPAKLGQFDKVSKMARRRIEGTDFLIVLYGIQWAGGLAGSEFNGIAVINESHQDVVLDCHAKMDSGYYGPSNRQRIEFDRIVNMSDSEFRQFCTSNARYRGTF